LPLDFVQAANMKTGMWKNEKRHHALYGDGKRNLAKAFSLRKVSAKYSMKFASLQRF
jgi:hypothetical protein